MKNADASLKWYKTKRREIARKRWSLLANALLAKNHQTDAIDSNFFNIFNIIPLPQLAIEDALWYQYSIDIDQNSYSVKIRHLLRTFTIQELTGFNNTGNVRVWPSEEALAYVCLKHRQVFDNKSVLEVGGGMSCMAGVLLGQFSKCSSIHVTDGNILSVENVREIIQQNHPSKCPLTCDVLVWNDYKQHGRVYDVILAADCLFFEDSRIHLIKLMYSLLKPDGVVLIMAPKRGDTLLKFATEARNVGFACTMHREYDDVVWSQHLKLSKDRHDYDEDLHYPLFLVLEKRQSSVPSTLRSILWCN